MYGIDTRLKGASILFALRQHKMGLTEVARATGHKRWWLNRRINGRVNPRTEELDQLAAIIGCDPNLFRFHYSRPLRGEVIQ